MTNTEDPTDPYARIVDLYDLEHDQLTEDISFYVNCVAVVGDPVLEFGCGTGRLLRPIAAAGYRITGLDRSPAMLGKADARLTPALRRRVTLIEGSMDGVLDLPGGTFGTAIFSLNGLMHLDDPTRQLNALQTAHALLDPRGQLLIDVVNPTPDTLNALGNGVSHEGTWIRQDGAHVDKFSARKLSASTQVIETQIWYDLIMADGSLRRVATAFNLRYLHLHELELMLTLAGFTSWQVYGSYDLDPFDDASERLIIAAELS
jgi:SAM-dependent methyltransferase